MKSNSSSQSGAWELLLLHMTVLQSVLMEAEPSLTALDLDVKGFFVLMLADEHPHPAELARALCLPRPTVTILIKRVEAAGYLKREGVAGDLRRFKLTVTPEGRRVCEQARRAIDAGFGTRLGRLNKTEIKSLGELLGKLTGPAENSAR